MQEGANREVGSFAFVGAVKNGQRRYIFLGIIRKYLRRPGRNKT
jgi:hypothetical protein